MPTQEEGQNPQAAHYVVANRNQVASDAGRLARIAASEALTAAAAIDDQKSRLRTQTAVSEALAKAGLAEPGVADARVPGVPALQVPSIIRVQVLLKARQIEAARQLATEALTEARAEANPSERMSSIMEVVQVLAETDLTEAAEDAANEALAVGRTIQYKYPFTLAAYAELLTDLGLAGPARAAAGDAVQAACRSTGSEWDRARKLAVLAKKLAHSGQDGPGKMAAATALTVARGEEDARRRAWGIADAADALAEMGQVLQAEAAAAEALATARQVSSGYSRVQALTNAGNALVRTGQADLAMRAAELALQAALSPSDSRFQVGGLERVADLFARIGLTEPALHAVRAIDDSQSRAQSLAQVSKALVLAGQTEPALHAVRAIDDSQSRTQALVAVVTGLVETGQVELAVQVAHELDDLQARAKALIVAAQALVKMGQLEAAHIAASEALAAAQAIGHAEQRRQVLTRMFSDLAEIGQIGLALQAARAIGLRSLTREVERLTRIGQDEPARELAREFGDPELQSRVSTISAQALVEVGQMEAAWVAAGEAHAAAREIEDMEPRAQILAHAAHILVKAGQMEAALTAAAEARAAANGIDDLESRAQILADVAWGLAEAASRFQDHAPSSGGAPDDEPMGGGKREQRYLECRVPRNVRHAGEFSIVVRITELQKAAGATPIAVPAIPALGTVIYIVLDVPPGCKILNETLATISLPPQGDSDEACFVLKAPNTSGAYSFTVTVLSAQGQLLAREPVTVEVSGRPTEPMHANMRPTRSVSPGQGPVVLVVSKITGRKYQYFLNRPGHSPVIDELQPEIDPRSRLKALINELNSMARGVGHWRPAGLRDELRAIGGDLWREFLPDKIREVLSDLRVGDDTLSVTCANSTLAVPWEMLHPIDPISGHSDFLVQLFDLVRSPETTAAWCERFTLSPAIIVLPDSQLPGALDEVRDIRETLGQADTYIREKVKLQQVLRNESFGLLHVAAHERDGQGTISMSARQRFSPSDLNEFAGSGGLWSRRRPLVFVNACGTAASRQTFTQFTSWAQRFFEAGAGGFIGSMWDVRSATASAFAQRFYKAIYEDGLPFGKALHDARDHSRSRDADPTWLAYAAHGNHLATAATSNSRAILAGDDN